MIIPVNYESRKKYYLNNIDLHCEVVLSKARGKLTKDAEKMIILLATRINNKFHYYDPDVKLDCLQEGLYQMFRNWMSYDELKTNNCFSYFTEIFKRGSAKGFNDWNNKKGDEDKTLIYISMDNSEYFNTI